MTSFNQNLLGSYSCNWICDMGKGDMWSGVYTGETEPSKIAHTFMQLCGHTI